MLNKYIVETKEKLYGSGIWIEQKRFFTKKEAVAYIKDSSLPKDRHRIIVEISF